MSAYGLGCRGIACSGRAASCRGGQQQDLDDAVGLRDPRIRVSDVIAEQSPIVPAAPLQPVQPVDERIEDGPSGRLDDLSPNPHIGVWSMVNFPVAKKAISFSSSNTFGISNR